MFHPWIIIMKNQMKDFLVNYESSSDNNKI
jgi:hypothetical protein